MMYEWDEHKASANLAKHDVSFADAVEFNWLDAVIIPDIRRDYVESRYTAFGAIGEHLYVLIFTPRNDKVRLISLRRANLRERKLYEKEKAIRR